MGMVDNRREPENCIGVQPLLTAGVLPVVAATIAFGMGIDKSGHSIHHTSVPGWASSQNSPMFLLQ